MKSPPELLPAVPVPPPLPVLVLPALPVLVLPALPVDVVPPVDVVALPPVDVAVLPPVLLVPLLVSLPPQATTTTESTNPRGRNLIAIPNFKFCM
ncbi:MAG TPA: hypothetical protein VNG33_04430 [Polyangiaceae bacterium]|nr:hypothetical protein [Polyangiaceae bacterium]